MTERILDINEFAARLNKSTRSIYRTLKNPPPGFPPKIKLGGSTGFRERDSDAYISWLAEQARAEADRAKAA
jgi:predicted DNA-binding transcriptional regulator AlpA